MHPYRSYRRWIVWTCGATPHHGYMTQRADHLWYALGEVKISSKLIYVVFLVIKCTHTTCIDKQMHCAINKDAMLLFWNYSSKTQCAMTTQPFPLRCSDSRACLAVKRWAPLRFCLSTVCTYHMGYIKDVCVIQEVPWSWYSMIKSVYHPETPKILLWNRYMELLLAVKRDECFFNFGFQVFAHILWYI